MDKFVPESQFVDMKSRFNEMGNWLCEKCKKALLGSGVNDVMMLCDECELKWPSVVKVRDCEKIEPEKESDKAEKTPSAFKAESDLEEKEGPPFKELIERDRSAEETAKKNTASLDRLSEELHRMIGEPVEESRVGSKDRNPRKYGRRKYDEG